MTTVREACTRALRRAGLVAQLEAPSAEDAAAALALLNEMMFEWQSHGVDVLLQAELTLDDTLVFWVPPLALTSAVIAARSYQGTWNASTNSPSLASASGTSGDIYRVSVAGSTALDDVASWSVDDFAVFDGAEWLKGLSSARFTSGVIAMLTVRVAATFAAPLPDEVKIAARDAWATMVPYYAKPPVAGFDMAIRAVPSRSLAVDRQEL